MGSMTQKFGRASAIHRPTAEDIAYAAGFFDGEGNITIATNRAHPRAHNLVYNMRIGASQNDPAPLFWLRDRWGGSVNIIKRREITGHLPGHIWGCFSRQAAAFLKDVLPYLKVKRDRANLAIAFQETVFQCGREGHTADYYSALAGFRAQVAALNGKKPISNGTSA